MTSKIQMLTQTISTGVENFTNFSQKHLRGSIVKIIGIIAILLAIGIQAGLGLGLYKFWESDIIVFYCFLPCELATLILTLTISGACLKYGLGMIRKDQVTLSDPKNPIQLMGDL